MATYRKSEDIINIGAYVRGTNPKIDLSIQLKDKIDAFLKQQVDEAVGFDETVKGLAQLAQQVPG
jgi:flagellum-specific ATP synthase